jgi:regulator of sigma E protease
MIIALILFILIFSFLILAHEGGHFFMAKRAGVRVEEFGIGYPPRIFGKKIGETIYSINWIPFGGFVKIYGEDLNEETLKDKESFSNKPPRIKTSILLAGVAVNFLIAIIFFYIFLGFNNFETYQAQIFDYDFPFGTQEVYPAVSYVVENSPAAEVGVEPYDLILSFNGQRVSETEKLIEKIDLNKGKEVNLLLENINSKETKEVKVLLREEKTEKEGLLGVGLGEISKISYQKGGNKMFSGILHTFNIGHFSLTAMGHLIKVSFQERNIEPLSQSVAGPVGILAFTKLTMAGGFWQVFYFVAVISLALGIVNILPIPASDGGRMVFVLYEIIFRKRAPAKLERNVNMVGFFVLVALLFLVTYKDIIQFKDILF